MLVWKWLELKYLQVYKEEIKHIFFDSTNSLLVISGIHSWDIKPMCYVAVPFLELLGRCFSP